MPALIPLLPLALLMAAAAAVDSKPGARPQQDVETKLEVLKRILPDAPETAAGLDALQRAIERAASRAALRLESASTVARPEVLEGELGYVPVDLAALLRPSAADAAGSALAAFVDSLARVVRRPLFERLAFEARQDGAVSVSALVRLYYLPPRASPLSRDELLGLKVTAIERLLADADWPLRRLRALSGTQTPPIFLSTLTLDRVEVGVQGVAPWPAVARDWAPFFGLDLVSLEWTRPDACQRFTARARFAAAPSQDDAPGQPDESAKGPAFLAGRTAEDAWCAAPAPTPEAAKLPPLRLSGDGPLTLRAADLDLADVALLLGRAAGQALVVDDAVTGRVGAELKNVTFDAALAALEPLGVFVSPPGQFRRVSRGRRPDPLALPAGSQEPVSFWFRRGRVEDVFALLADIAGDPVLVPRPPLPAVSVTADDVPWDVVYEAVAASAGMVLRHDTGLFRVERPGQPAAELIAPVGGFIGSRFGLSAVYGDQLELSALTASGEAWSAWMVTPGGSLLEYRAGGRFFDGQVGAVGPTGVELQIEITDPLSPVRSRTRRIALAPGP